MKKAFTLIELLVVIAIIAILAAILFPVFTRAKEAAKKTQTLSNFKQYGTAAAMYLSDNDDLYPNAFSPITTANPIQYRWNFYISVPAGWRGNGVHNVNPRMAEDAMHWGNTMYMYTKNYDIMEASGLELDDLGVTDTRLLKPAKINIGYNGILMNYPQTGVQQVTQVPLFWAGRGKMNVDGFALSTPILRCDGAGPCFFNPAGLPQPGASFPGALFTMASAWVYGDGMHFVMNDTHAKWRNLRGPDDGTLIQNYAINPFARYSAGGVPTHYWTCGGYACIFRPDQDFIF